MGIVFVIFGYLSGSFPTGYLIGKLFGKDVRKEGYQKISASNVHKVVSIWAALPVGVIDFLKGFLPVCIGKMVGIELVYLEITGIASVIGHNWPLYLGFKGGGRGIATTFGMLVVLIPKISLLGGFLFLLLSLVIGSSPIPTIITFAGLPLISYLFKKPGSIILTLVFIFILLMFTRIAAGIPEIKRSKNPAKVFLRRLIYDR